MADRFPGEIHIGGTLRVAGHDPDDVSEFLGQCSEQPTDLGESGQRDALTVDVISASLSMPGAVSLAQLPAQRWHLTRSDSLRALEPRGSVVSGASLMPFRL